MKNGILWLLMVLLCLGGCGRREPEKIELPPALPAVEEKPETEPAPEPEIKPEIEAEPEPEEVPAPPESLSAEEEQAIKEKLLAADNPEGVGEEVLDAFAQWICGHDGQWFRENYTGEDCQWELGTRDNGWIVLTARTPLADDGLGDLQTVGYDNGQVTLGASGTWQE